MTTLIERAKAALENATPGPWEYQASFSAMPERKEEWCYKIVDANGRDFINKEATLNSKEAIYYGRFDKDTGRLIAMAPELARALIEAEELAEAVDRWDTYVAEGNDAANQYEAMMKALAAYLAVTEGGAI